MICKNKLIGVTTGLQTVHNGRAYNTHIKVSQKLEFIKMATSGQTQEMPSVQPGYYEYQLNQPSTSFSQISPISGVSHSFQSNFN